MGNAETRAFNSMAVTMKKFVQETVKGPINGAFLYSCYSHCGWINNDRWAELVVNELSLRQAFWNWYKGSGEVVIEDCKVHHFGDQCNPTCMDNMTHVMNLVETDIRKENDRYN